MREDKKLKLTFFQAFTHYGIVWLLLAPSLFIIWSIAKAYFTVTDPDVVPDLDMVKVSLPFLLLSVVFGVFQYRRLNFREFIVPYTDEQFQEAVERTIEDLEWYIEVNEKTYFRAIRPWNWTGSWGEMVTVIKDKDRILINSICDPDRWFSIASYGWNKKNINTFLKNLSDVLNNRPKEIKIEQEINEWSLKRILIRVLAYPICILFVVIGAFMIFEAPTSRAVVAGLGAILLGGAYLYWDITLIRVYHRTKRRKSPDV